MTDSDECPKCREREDLSHLLKDCWYSGLLWTRLTALYQATDNRRQRYDKNSLAFFLGTGLSKAKIKLHLEIIRRLCAKERPNILPKMIIAQ